MGFPKATRTGSRKALASGRANDGRDMLTGRSPPPSVGGEARFLSVGGGYLLNKLVTKLPLH